jgi:hypothetical protein
VSESIRAATTSKMFERVLAEHITSPSQVILYIIDATKSSPIEVQKMPKEKRDAAGESLAISRLSLSSSRSASSIHDGFS